MSTPEFQHSDVYRHVAVYSTPAEDAWKPDHDRAMTCRKCEATIRIGLSLFEFIEKFEHAWRDGVFRGVQPFNERDETDILDSYRMWLHRTNALLESEVPSFERDYDAVDGADELRKFAAKAISKLTNWTAPRLSRAVGLRDHQLTEEGAAALDRIIASTAPLPYSPKQPVAELSAEEFKRRARR